MLEPKTITIKREGGDMEFFLSPLPALTAIKLDKRVLTLLLPALSGFKELSLDSSIDLNALTKGVSEALGRMDDKDFEELVLQLLSTAVYQKQGSAPLELNDKHNINKVFGGELISLYKLLFEVMRYNKFSPFVLLEGGGSVMSRILTSSGQTNKEGKTGKELEKSALL